MPHPVYDGQAPFIDAGPHGYFNDDEVSATVLRGHTQFRIKAKIDRLKNTNLGKNLQEQIKLCCGLPFGRYGTIQAPADVMFQYCTPLLKKLAPQTILEDVTLEPFLHAPTYDLELVAKDSSAEITIIGQEECLSTPAFFMSPIPMVEIAKLPPNIPLIRASEIQIAPIERGQRSLSSAQGRVTTQDGRFFYFKPRLELREPDFERELQIFSRIASASLGPEVRVPRLEGLVVSGENDEMVAGLLMTMIESSDLGCHLMSEGLWGRLEVHKKWEEQVTAIVGELHANGIVWGDVNPMNVAIDVDLNAWVIDFGGMNNIDFVDDENRETVQGDWQGIERLFRWWLPKRARKLRAQTKS